MSGKLSVFLNSRWFTIISWVFTGVIVSGMLTGTLWWTRSVASASAILPEPTTAPDQINQTVPLPALAGVGSRQSIGRQIELKTVMPAERPRYDITRYTVGRGDSVFAIAKELKITPETVLWANFETLQDSPDMLKPGQELDIPPVDGIYYQWKEGDTLESVAKEFEITPDAILNWPGNDLDLTDPKIKPDDKVMVPGGKREFIQWLIPTVARGASGTSSILGSSCPLGAVGSGAFVWPADNNYLSGNDYWSGHLGIDIAAGEGAAIYAADNGVVTMAQGGYNYGYGNVIQIDHENGYSTLYAHLSQINVSICQSVYSGQLIGLAGSTGNAFGAHLHFEVRLNGGFINPWYVLP
jgi:murein DD-endopeptidase MepM/ murein hydrolase activator NlpD